MSAVRGGLWKRFLSLLPSDTEVVATVTTVHGSGLYTVTPTGGGAFKARSEATYSASDKVFVRGKTIVGPAPNLTSTTIDI